MGRPSDHKRSARRPGKRERARVKKPRRTTVSTVGGAGTVREIRAGRKHLARRLRAFGAGRPINRGTANPESAGLEGTATLPTPASHSITQCSGLVAPVTDKERA